MSSADLNSLADTSLRLFDAAAKSRAAMLEDAAEGLEWTAHLLLRNLHELGPMRASDVAECLHLDPSTVSRQVAGLVRDGLLERRSDPHDGRASILAPTEAGLRAIDDQTHRRTDYFRTMLATWDDDDLAVLGRLLARFTDDYLAAHDARMAARGRRRAAHPTRTGAHA